MSASLGFGTVNSGQTPNMKGSFSEAIAMADKETSYIHLGIIKDNPEADFVIDIAIGPICAENIIIRNFPVYSDLDGDIRMILPIHISRYERISIRCESETGNEEFRFILKGSNSIEWPTKYYEDWKLKGVAHCRNPDCFWHGLFSRCKSIESHIGTGACSEEGADTEYQTGLVCPECWLPVKEL